MKKNLLYTLLGLALVISTTSVSAQNAGLASPIITEIMYNPPESGNDTLEFLEIYNPNLSNAYNLEGAYFSSGIEYTFPVGYSLPGGAYVILSGDSVVFEEWYGMESFEWTGGTALSNDGEGITLRTDNGLFVLDSVYFDDTNAWADADQTGYSLVLCDVNADNNLPESWTLSENATGLTVNSLPIYADPGAASTCTAVGVADDNVITTLIYPNPTEGLFTIQFADLKQNASLDIHNTLGQMVYSQVLSQGLSSTTVDADLVSGLYIVTLTTGDETEQIRLVVE